MARVSSTELGTTDRDSCGLQQKLQPKESMNRVLVLHRTEIPQDYRVPALDGLDDAKVASSSFLAASDS